MKAQVNTSLPNHYKLAALAIALRITKAEAMGHLVKLWSWAYDYALDGNLEHFTPELIASEGAWWTGDAAEFVRAMTQCGGKKRGFLEQTAAGFVLHDWKDEQNDPVGRRESWKKNTAEWRKRQVAAAAGQPLALKKRAVCQMCGDDGWRIDIEHGKSYKVPCRCNKVGFPRVEVERRDGGWVEVPVKEIV